MADNKERLQNHNSELEEILLVTETLPKVNEIKNSLIPGLFTKQSIDKFTVSTRTNGYNFIVNHSLGDKPIFVTVIASKQPTVSGDLFILTGILQGGGLGSYTNVRCAYSNYNANGNYNLIDTSTVEITVDNEKVTFSNKLYFAENIEYTLVTMV